MTKKEILKRVKEIQEEQGDLETELCFLKAELKMIEDPSFHGWVKTS